MTEEEYFQIAGGNQILNKKQEESVKQEEPIKKRGRPKKPVYDISRNEQGKVQVQARVQNESKIQTINQINETISNDSNDNKQKMKQIMLNEFKDELTRIQIEIDIKNEMYNQYNKDIYKKQANQLKDRYNEIINKIRILQTLYKG